MSYGSPNVFHSILKIGIIQSKNVLILLQIYVKNVYLMASIIEAVKFLSEHQISYVLRERFCQDSPENYFGRQRSA